MIFTFVSFKGGVGRTHTLVHTGLRLAHQVRKLKLRVLLVDMDLDAPGFEPYFPEADLGSCGGFEALLAGYRAAGAQRAEWLNEALHPPKLGDESSPWFISFDEAPNLTLLPAGRVALSEGGYEKALAALAEERAEGRGFFQDFRSALKTHWDYAFLDARAGLAELTFASAINLADVLVPCVRLNQANLDGIRDMYGTFLARGEGEPWKRRGLVVPVLTPVPPRSGADLQDWIEKATGTFFPEWKPEDGDGGSELRLTDVQAMFPLVHRIFDDEAARLGERRFLSLKGEPAGGTDEETPIFTTIEKVVRHFRALNADADAGGARFVEMHFLNNLEDHERALQFWVKQVRLRPLDDEVWWSFMYSYPLDEYSALQSKAARNLQRKARKVLDSLIEDWRQALAVNQLSGGAEALARPLLLRFFTFGGDGPDAGLEVVDEAISLAKDGLFLAMAEHVAGEVVTDILENRRREDLVDRLGRPVTWELAEHHFRASLRHARENDKVIPGAVYGRLSKVLEKMNRCGEAVRFLDHSLVDIVSAQRSKEDRAMVLLQQARILEWIGHYDWSLRDSAKAAQYDAEDSAVLLHLQMAAGYCGQHKLARNVFISLANLYPENADSCYAEVMRLALFGKLGVARDLVATVRQLTKEGWLYYLAKGVVDLLDGKVSRSWRAFENAARQKEDGLSVAMSSAVAALDGKSRQAHLDGDLDDGTIFRMLAAYAQDDQEALESLAARIEIEKEAAIKRWCVVLLRAMNQALKGDPEAPQAMELVKRQLTDLPLLAVVHQNNFVCRVIEMVWDRRKQKGSRQFVQPIHDLLGRVHEVPAPSPESLTPRDESESLPSLRFVPDTWNPESRTASATAGNGDRPWPGSSS